MGFGYRPGRHGRGRRRGYQPSGTNRLMTHETTLDDLRGGDDVEILDVRDTDARMHTLRFGMAEGARAHCVIRVPAGPIVMRSGRQEIAVGRRLARRIHVRRIDRHPEDSSQA